VLLTLIEMQAPSKAGKINRTSGTSTLSISQENLFKVKSSPGSNIQKPRAFSRVEARYPQQEQVEVVVGDEPVDMWVRVGFVKINAEVFKAALYYNWN